MQAFRNPQLKLPGIIIQDVRCQISCPSSSAANSHSFFAFSALLNADSRVAPQVMHPGSSIHSFSVIGIHLTLYYFFNHFHTYFLYRLMFWNYNRPAIIISGVTYGINRILIRSGIKYDTVCPPRVKHHAHSLLDILLSI